MSRRTLVIAVFACLATAAAHASSPGPISLHGDNPNYFSWQGKPTILITSGEHYGAVLNLDFDYVKYFDELKSHGLNHTRTFSGVYRENADAFGITDNPLAPKPNRYICPWPRSKTPGYFDGGNKFDLKKWDPKYFLRLRDFMTQAQKRGVVVELTLFCPMYKDILWEACPMNSANNVNGIGKCPRNEPYTLRHPKLLEVQLAVTRKIVRELRDFDNLYYEVCNEPYFGGVTIPWQHKIVDTIVAVEKNFANKHLISMNIANGRKKVTNPHPAVSIFNFHYCVPPDTVSMNSHLHKVIGENETGFRGGDDLLYRTEGWDFLLAGGALYNNLDYSFTARFPDGSFRGYKSPGGGSRELRQQLGILKKFLYSFEFTSMKPDNSIVSAVSPKLTATALVDPGKAYAIYLHVPLSKNPKNLQKQLREGIEADVSLKLPQGRFRVDWIDTKTGEIGKQRSFEHGGGKRQLKSPPFSNDIALRIVRQPS